MSDKRKLHLIQSADKGLMPEVLPPPPRGFSPSAATRDRVRARLRQMRDNAAVLAAAASLGAGCSEQHGGGGGDPPPAGTGAAGVAAGSGGTAAAAGSGGKAGASGSGGKAGSSGSGGKAGLGGVAGYAVVDPLPQPFACAKPPALESKTSAKWSGTQALLITLSAAQSVEGPAFLQKVATDAANVSGAVDQSMYPAAARLTLQSGSWPRSTTALLSFMCRMPDNSYGTHTITLRLDTSSPSASGTVPITTAAGEDAGI